MTTITDYDNVPLETSEQDLLKIVGEVKHGYDSGITLPLEYRLGQLRDLYYGLLDNEKALKEALKKDMNKDPYEVDLAELHTAYGGIETCIYNLEKWAKDEPVSTTIAFQQCKPHIKKVPLGTVLVISPWNYPICLSVSPIAAAIAAGNSVILKPSEVTPNTSKVLTTILNTVLDPRTFRSVNGAIPETTTLLNQPFDKILYTGNGTVGRIVAKTAAEHLTPCVLELGGKSPTIVTSNANLAVAARRILWGKGVNAGQTCIAPDYLLVQESVGPQFKQELKKAYAAFFGDGLTPATPYSHIVSRRHYDRLVDYLNTTKGEIILGGQTDAETLFIAPTVIDDINVTDALFKDEIFGPTIGIIYYKTNEDAVNIIKQYHDTPLALYVFTEDASEKKLFSDRTRSGSIVFNETLLHFGIHDLPFGGTGASGYGEYHGYYGYLGFSHLRSTIDQPAWSEPFLGVRYPPLNATKLDTVGKLSITGPLFPRTGPVNSGSDYWLKFFWKRTFNVFVIAWALILSRFR